jgi:hypothetical protein
MPTSPKRDRWTEADVLALPAGEHDYFERKSGQLFADSTKLLDSLAKALSAFANSGGGHILLGVADDGSFDGVPTVKGATPTKDWLEQKIPQLVEYALNDFRVHKVEAEAASSQIPPGTAVIVIDVGDSALAPHQCAFGGQQSRKGVYYYRQGSHSEPAPHFYLELLRQRLTDAALTATPRRIVFITGSSSERGIFALLALPMMVENVGRAAAYKWAIDWRLTDVQPSRTSAYLLNPSQWWIGDPTSGVRLDDTILPGGRVEERLKFGLVLSPEVSGADALIQGELVWLLEETKVEYRIATETGVSDWSVVRLDDHLKEGLLAESIKTIAT